MRKLCWLLARGRLCAKEARKSNNRTKQSEMKPNSLNLKSLNKSSTECWGVLRNCEQNKKQCGFFQERPWAGSQGKSYSAQATGKYKSANILLEME